MAKRGAKFWHSELRFFIQPHPELHPEAGEIYVPKPRQGLALLCDGGLRFEDADMHINFNSNDFLIVAIGDTIVRVLWERLIGFELRMPATDTDAETLRRARDLH